MIGHVSSFAPALARESLVQQMQSDLTDVTNEISSGRKTKPSGGSQLYELHLAADQQTAVQTVITNANNRLGVIQNALDGISTVAQQVSSATIDPGTADGDSQSVLASQARDAMDQVVGLMNTRDNGQAVFAGSDGANAPMQSAGAIGGLQSIVNGIVSAAVTAKGGPLSEADIDNLLNGPNGISSVFDDTNTDPTKRFTGAAYVGTDDGKATTVVTGASQTVSYDVKANKPAFRDLMKGLAVLSLMDLPSTQLNDAAKAALQEDGGNIVRAAQTELTTTQAGLGVTQATLQRAADIQKIASSATQEQILGMEQSDPYADSQRLSALQTQLQATYEITAQLSKLSLTNYIET